MTEKEKPRIVADNLALNIGLTYISTDSYWCRDNVRITKIQEETTPTGSTIIRLIGHKNGKNAPFKINLARCIELTTPDEQIFPKPADYFRKVGQENQWPDIEWKPRNHLYYRVNGDQIFGNTEYFVSEIYTDMLDLSRSPEWVQQGEKMPNGKRAWVRVPRYWKQGSPAAYKFTRGQTFYNHQNGWDDATRVIQIKDAVPDKFNLERGEIENGFVDFQEYEMKPGKMSGKDKIISHKTHKMTQAEFVKFLGIDIIPASGI